MSMKNHIHALSKALAEHHVAQGQMAKSMMDDCDEDSQERETYRKVIESHTAVADAATRCMAACDKADAGDELEKLVPAPAGFTVVHDAAPNVRMVPRFGSPPLPPPDKSEVYREVFGIADAQE